ncbi:hypothetical protein CKO21_13260 [Rhodovibrio salinarum]|uniref:Iron transporter n=2 Tax=Rhodovibrio salinarum TaxID=1087 RepID=A0A934QKH6_9PROT|nr:hypothetical protein [Rhodovibrio salinarum]
MAAGVAAIAMTAPMFALPAQAAETPIGDAVQKNGMEIAAVYLQPVVMEPSLPGLEHEADVHLEADIHAMKDSENGFGPGDWVAYLGITYRIEKQDSSWSTSGSFMPMVANDGPHYGANIKLDGPGKYTLSYHIMPPPYQGFYRHTDEETGVAEWWKPFDVEWEFAYAGSGKKGSY